MKKIFKKKNFKIFISFVGVIIGLCYLLTGLFFFLGVRNIRYDDVPHRDAATRTQSLCEFMLKNKNYYYPTYYIDNIFSNEYFGFEILCDNRIYYDSVSSIQGENSLYYYFVITIRNNKIHNIVDASEIMSKELSLIFSDAEGSVIEHSWIREIISSEDADATFYIRTVVNPELYVYWDDIQESYIYSHEITTYMIISSIVGVMFFAAGMIYLINNYIKSEDRRTAQFKIGQYIDRIPTVGFFALIVTALVLTVLGLVKIYDCIVWKFAGGLLFAALIFLLFAIFMCGFVPSVLRRNAKKSFIKDSPLISFMIQKWGGFTVFVKAVVITLVFAVLFLVCTVVVYISKNAAGIWCAVFVGILYAGTMIYVAGDYSKIEKLYEEYGKGNWQVETPKIKSIMRNLANTFDDIKKTMQETLDKSVRDERTKAELITNVSHDIKTPLTSIINYIGLLSKDDVTEEQRKEYYEVLNRQSSRMKKLIEDLIEASKAATHNIELHITECNIGTLLNQINAEYDVQSAKNRLKIILSTPENPLMVLADSQRLFRVFDNLLSNACKYSLEGSRIFIKAVNKDGMALVEFRNTCRELPQISVEELTERFVRGDISRTSEGSGLGLAIAKDLTELMGGRLSLKIDNDTFYATVELKTLVQNS